MKYIFTSECYPFHSSCFTWQFGSSINLPLIRKKHESIIINDYYCRLKIIIIEPACENLPCLKNIYYMRFCNSVSFLYEGFVFHLFPLSSSVFFHVPYLQRVTTWLNAVLSMLLLSRLFNNILTHCNAI